MVNVMTEMDLLELTLMPKGEYFGGGGGLAAADALTHWGRDNTTAISQTTLSSAFSWMKML